MRSSLGDGIDEALEIERALFPPAGLELIPPIGIGRHVLSVVNRGWGALDDVQLLARFAEIGDRLHRARARADDRNALVGESGEATHGVAFGIFIIPARGVECVTLEGGGAGDAGKLRPAEDATRHAQEAGADLVAAIGCNDPTAGRLVPVGPTDARLEQGAIGVLSE